MLLLLLLATAAAALSLDDDLLLRCDRLGTSCGLLAAAAASTATSSRLRAEFFGGGAARCDELLGTTSLVTLLILGLDLRLGLLLTGEIFSKVPRSAADT